MLELRNGLSVADMEKLDKSIDMKDRFNLTRTMANEEIKREKLNFLYLGITIADAVRIAVASVYNKKNTPGYKRWIKRKQREIRNLLKIKSKTNFWETVKKSKRL